MTKEMILKKLYNVNTWLIKARNNKNWEEYELAVKEYNRLSNILNTLN